MTSIGWAAALALVPAALGACGGIARSDRQQETQDAGSADHASPVSETVVLFGGTVSPGGSDVGDTWTWNGAAWSASQAEGPELRTFAACAAAHGQAVLSGGLDENDNAATIWNDTWSWNGSIWTQLAAMGPSPPRYLATAAAVGDQIVLFGGNDLGAFLNDTWVWDGSTWSQARPGGNGPSPRDSAAMASLNGELVLFGGRWSDGHGNVTALGDTWVWNGSTWTQIDTTGAAAPAPRWGAAAASVGGTVVLYGGLADLNDPLGDTWTWNGSAWAQVAQSGPSPRYGAGLAAMNGRGLLFGGFEGGFGWIGKWTDDTWLWDGSSWTQLAVSGPPARSNVCMVEVQRGG
jgi:hypothetical protein